MLPNIAISFTYNDIKGIFVFTFNMRVVRKNDTGRNGYHNPDEEVAFKVIIDTKDSFPFKSPKINFS